MPPPLVQSGLPKAGKVGRFLRSLCPHFGGVGAVCFEVQSKALRREHPVLTLRTLRHPAFAGKSASKHTRRSVAEARYGNARLSAYGEGRQALVG